MLVAYGIWNHQLLSSHSNHHYLSSSFLNRVYSIGPNANRLENVPSSLTTLLGRLSNVYLYEICDTWSQLME